MAGPWLVHGAFVVGRGRPRGGSVVPLWTVHGAPIVCPHIRPWWVHGSSMVSPWCLHGVPMVLPWCYRGIAVDLPWCFHRETVFPRGFAAPCLLPATYIAAYQEVTVVEPRSTLSHRSASCRTSGVPGCSRAACAAGWRRYDARVQKSQVHSRWFACISMELPFSIGATQQTTDNPRKEEHKAQFFGHGALIRAEPRFTPISLSRSGGRSSVKKRPQKQAACTALLSISRTLRTHSTSSSGDSPSQLLGLAWCGQGQRPGRWAGECQGRRRGEWK